MAGKAGCQIISRAYRGQYRGQACVFAFLKTYFIVLEDEGKKGKGDRPIIYLDRVNQKILAAYMDVFRSIAIFFTPVLWYLHLLEPWHIYLLAFLDNQTVNQIKNNVKKLLDAVGLKIGPSHTELILTPNGPRIVESHNRIGEDNFCELVELACEVDYLTLSLGCGLGLVEKPQKFEISKASAIRFFAPQAGIVEKVIGVDEVAAEDDVFELNLSLEKGNTIAETKSSWDRSGHIIVSGKKVEVTIRRADELLNRKNSNQSKVISIE